MPSFLHKYGAFCDTIQQKMKAINKHKNPELQENMILS